MERAGYFSECLLHPSCPLVAQLYALLASFASLTTLSLQVYNWKTIDFRDLDVDEMVKEEVCKLTGNDEYVAGDLSVEIDTRVKAALHPETMAAPADRARGPRGACRGASPWPRSRAPRAP